MFPLRISVVIPNFNYADKLEGAIHSVLDQNYPNLDLRVVDGGSTDGSLQIIKRYEDHVSFWRSSPDGGQYEAINEGFQNADGEIFCWLNSDDRQFPWTLSNVSEVFRRFPEVDWIMGIPGRSHQGVLLQQFDSTRIYPRELLRAALFCDEPFGWIQQESCFWRRSLWERVGGLDTRYKLAADFDLWRRFAAYALLHKVSVGLGSFNEWGGNRSITQKDTYMKEVESIINGLPTEDAQTRQTVLKALKYLPKVRKIARNRAPRVLGLNRFQGSRIEWNSGVKDFKIYSYGFF